MMFVNIIVGGRMTDKVKRLITYCTGILNNEDGGELYKMYLHDIKSITPEELIVVENEQLKLGCTAKELLIVVDKLMNVFHGSLSEYQYKEIPEFIKIMIEENKALEDKLETFKPSMKDIKHMKKESLIEFLESLREYNFHMEKVENIIFSYLEKKGAHFDGLKIMWSLHDTIRTLLKKLLVDSRVNKPVNLIVELGQLYFMLFGVTQKQNLVLFPVAIEKLTNDQFVSMYRESFDYGFSYIERPKALKREEHIKMDKLNELIHTDTGHLQLETLITILNVLPIDFTFVDANDEVAYFNDSKERIFPRSSSIIGRHVKNCHPPESVHVVEEILKSFKTGKKDKAEFWIKMRGMMVYIYYLPIFGKDGTYKGTLEISQELTKLRALEGEKRLLDKQ